MHDATDIRAQLEEERRIIDAATEGPWEAIPTPCWSIAAQDHECGCGACWSDVADGIENDADAAFIAHARTGYPLALRALQTVMELCDTLSTPTMHDSDRQIGRIEGLREVRQLIEGVYGDG